MPSEHKPPEPQERIPQKHGAAIAALSTAAAIAWAAVLVLYICDEMQVRTDHETTWMTAFIALIISFTAIGTGVAAYIERAMAENLAAREGETTRPILQPVPSLPGHHTVNRELALAAIGSYPVHEQRAPLRAVAGGMPLRPEVAGQLFRLGVADVQAERRHRR